jgi:hypothetical protein
MVNIKPSRRTQELCPADRNVPDEAIEPASSIAMTASSSSSMVTGEIRQLWPFSGFPEHARVLAVSLASFSSLSPSILIARFNSHR